MEGKELQQMTHDERVAFCRHESLKFLCRMVIGPESLAWNRRTWETVAYNIANKVLELKRKTAP